MLRICYVESNALIHEAFSARDILRGLRANPPVSFGNREAHPDRSP